MQVDVSIIQGALVVIAAGVVVQSVILCGGLWLSARSYGLARVELERRLDRLEADLSSTSDAARRMAETVDGLAGRASSMLGHGERVVSAVGAIAHPKWWLLASAAKRLLGRRRNGSGETYRTGSGHAEPGSR